MRHWSATESDRENKRRCRWKIPLCPIPSVRRYFLLINCSPQVQRAGSLQAQLTSGVSLQRQRFASSLLCSSTFFWWLNVKVDATLNHHRSYYSLSIYLSLFHWLFFHHIYFLPTCIFSQVVKTSFPSLFPSISDISGFFCPFFI